MDSYLLDSDRLESLSSTGLMYSDADPAYDRLSRLAARLLNAPTAYISLVDDRRQFFKSHHGLGEPHATLRQTPVADSFCQHVVIRRQPLVINDARLDPLVTDNRAITDLGIIAYLGIPLMFNEHVIGSFCVIDGKPRVWADDDLTLFTELSETVIEAIRLDAEHQQSLATNSSNAEAGRSEESLRDACIRLETAQSVGALATWTWDIAKNSVVADANLARLFSVSPEVARGGPIESYIRAIHPDDSERVVRTIGEAVASGTIYDEEYRLVQPDGSVRWVRAKGQVVRDSEHRAIGLHGVVVDVTENKQCQQVIVESEDRYRVLVDSVDKGFCIIELIYDANDKAIDFRYIEINQAFETMTGIVDAVGKTIRELGFDAESHGIEAFDFVVRTRASLRLENKSSQSADRCWEVYVSPIGRPDQSRLALLYKDISDSKRSSLRAESEKVRDCLGNLRSTLSEIHYPVIVTDAEFGIIFINPAAEELCGWTVEAAGGRPLSEIFRIPRRELGSSSTGGIGRLISRIRRGVGSWSRLTTPGYSISATSYLTGISPHALEVWERRYGFPTPTRSLLGHKRYSAEQVTVLTHLAKLAAAGRPVAEMINDYQLGILIL